MAASIQESQLYEPVRKFWTDAGYLVRGEVAGCDVVACCGDELIAIELKTALNLDVILQATQRQRLCSQAWIAVPRPGRSLRTRRWQQLLHLLRRLELGLLLVDLNRRPAQVEAVLIGLPFDRALSRSGCQKQARRLRDEFSRRHGDHNTGGVRQTRLMTVYREQSLLVASLLSSRESASASQLRRLGGPDKTYSILYKNHYGWFEARGSGQYALTPAGLAALGEQPDLAGQLLAESAGIPPAPPAIPVGSEQF